MSTDFRHSWRSLWRDRGFALTAILSLAVGIGANTAIFSLVNGILLRPLDFPAPERLVAISLSSPQVRESAAFGGKLPINVAQLIEWRKRARSFESIGAYRNASMSITGDGTAELVPGAVVSANFFRVLGIGPALGRSFFEEEDQAGKHHEVMLAASLWRRRYQADPKLIGRQIGIGGTPYLVVGILPADFEFPTEPRDMGKHLTGAPEIFRPLGYEPDETKPHFGDLNYAAIARLRDGVSVERARADLGAVEAGLDAETGEAWRLTPSIVPLREQLAGDTRRSLLLLACAVGAVLLVLCVNLANLLLARAAGRAQEQAIRIAVGASRWQLARQSLMETGILAAIGGAAGILLALFGVQWLLAAAPVELPRLHAVTVDARVLCFALALSAATGLLFGLLPALQSAAASSPYETLKAGRGAIGAGRGMRIRNLLVGLEVALCAALLVTAGLLLDSFVRLTTIDKGFDIERVLAVDMTLPGAKYAKPEDRSGFFDRVLGQARALPGVESAAISSYLPLEGESWVDFIATENDPRPEPQRPSSNLRFVSPGLFHTLGIPLRAGRDFEAGDRNRMVAVISESLARQLWPHENAVGRTLVDLQRHLQVVGVAADARTTSVDSDPVNMLYIPLWQRPQYSSSVLVRTAMDPKSIAAALRAAVWSADRDVPVPRERTLREILSASLARRRFQTTLLALFAAAALALAAFGTYGVVAYAVTRRRPELGIRMALGAGKGDVLRMVLRQGMTPVLAGLAAGALAALWIGQLVSSMLFRVSPRDPAAFAIASAVLLLVSAAACWIPARRAARVDPMQALRFE